MRCPAQLRGLCIHGRILPPLEDCADCDGLAVVMRGKHTHYAEGAAVAFGLMGMAEAIRGREWSGMPDDSWMAEAK